ncbi:Hypothetical protein Cul210932_0206 [Corynebacterium ulcerans]|nr:Hypothetical protein Cul210932_0206 [Corynebacterium ulcerans]AIU90807.1 Hypothetical protein Cul05146_0213 [Corynebacterium ulcerans]ALD93944.1 Hypothetical protein Cul131001_0210 [Corynebacterium ulcerans]
MDRHFTGDYPVNPHSRLFQDHCLAHIPSGFVIHNTGVGISPTPM